MPRQRWICIILLVCLLVTLLPAPVQAQTVLSHSGDIETAKPTKEEITDAYHKYLQLYRTENSYDAFRDNWAVNQTKEAAYGELVTMKDAYSEYYPKAWDATYAQSPSVVAPYAAGALTETALNAGLHYLNFARFLAGVPAVKMASRLNSSAQHDSVVMAANNKLAHYQEKPEDMDESFFQYSINGLPESISRGNGDIGTTVLDGHIQAWLEDTGSVENITGVGHRRQMLSVDYPYVGFGVAFRSTRNDPTYVNYATFHSDIDSKNTGEELSIRYNFVSWPASGNFPVQMMSADSPWSIDFSLAYSLGSDYSVEITRASDGKTWRLDENTGTADVSMKQPYLVKDSRKLVFHLGTDNVDQYSGVYTVRVNGVKDRWNNPVDMEYTIDFFDMEKYGLHDYDPANAEVTETCCRNFGFTINRCTTCGNVKIYDYVDQLEHDWSEATCSTQSTCSMCGLKRGLPKAHTWQAATCKTAKTCSVCGYSEGALADHNWQAATCTAPKTCAVCGLTEGNPIGHSYTGAGLCIYCREVDPALKPQPGTATYTRVAGNDRYQTAFAAATELKTSKNIYQFPSIVVASGTSFPDALAGSSLAKVKYAPIVLVKPGNVKQVKEYIQANVMPNGTVYLLGGEKAVPKSMETGLDGYNVIRLGGNDRYETNMQILKEVEIGSKPMIVCTGKAFADSLSASALGYPILLVKDRLTDEQKTMLESHRGWYYIIGGTNAVSARVEEELAQYGKVTRIAGKDRYETSVLVAKEFFPAAQMAVLAYGKNFPDGLSGGPLANRNSAPLILTQAGKESVAAEYIRGSIINGGYALGGTAVLPDKSIKQVFGMQ